jgi:ParB family chromosome partitioning protein
MMEELGETQESLSRKVGKDRSSVANILRILSLPSAIQKDVIDGRLTAGHARVLAGVKNQSAQNHLRELIIAKALSVRQTEELAKRIGSSRRERKLDSEENHYFNSLADEMKHSLGTKVEIVRRGKGGRVIIHFFSNDDLDRLIQLLR